MRGIYRYGVEHWGKDQAEAYARKLSAKFDAIGKEKVFARIISTTIGVEGYFCTCESHFIYWRLIGKNAVAIVAVLHRKMHQPDRIRRAFSASV